ncbi:MAG: hypothetical protein ACE37J_09055 [Pikeienuella sp.]|uniref:hypothetical protein n=1 Tax=Pikeienuella sp. TaxID=2831957 RepID=UPI00391CC1A1
MGMEDQAAAALAAADFPAAPLSLLRLRPGRAAAFRAGGAFVKVYLGPEAEARADAAIAGRRGPPGSKGRAARSPPPPARSPARPSRANGWRRSGSGT